MNRGHLLQRDPPRTRPYWLPRPATASIGVIANLLDSLVSFQPRDLVAVLFAASLLALMQVGHFIIYNPFVSGPDGDPVAEYFTLAQYVFPAACVFAGIWRNSGVLNLSGILAFTLFLALAAASTLWSVDAGLTLRSTFLLIAFLLAVTTTTRAVGAVRTASILAHIMGLAMVVSALLALFVPSIGQHNIDDLVQGEHVGSWRGLFAHKNSLGAYAAFAVVIVLAFRDRLPRWTVLPYLTAAIACVLFSNSTTSLVAAIFGVFSMSVALPLMRRTSAQLAAAGMGALLLCAGATLTAVTMLGWGELFAGTKVETLTGRTEIWTVALDIFLSRPLLGVGFGAGSSFARPVLQEMTFAEAVDPHSGYLAMLLDLGVVGLVLFLLPAALAFSRLLRMRGTIDRVQAVAGTALLMSLMGAITEVSPFLVQGSAGFFYFFSLVLLQLSRQASARPLESAGAGTPDANRQPPRPPNSPMY